MQYTDRDVMPNENPNIEMKLENFIIFKCWKDVICIFSSYIPVPEINKSITKGRRSLYDLYTPQVKNSEIFSKRKNMEICKKHTIYVKHRLMIYNITKLNCV